MVLEKRDPVRVASPLYIGQIRLLDRATGLPVWTEQEYAGLIQRDDVLFDVVIDPTDDLLGFCITLLTSRDAEVIKIAVRPDEHGKGIGGRLLRRALDYAHQKGCESCFLEVRPSNTGALGFYTRHGFQVVSRRKDYYIQPREDALVMRHTLTVRPEPR